MDLLSTENSLSWCCILSYSGQISIKASRTFSLRWITFISVYVHSTIKCMIPRNRDFLLQQQLGWYDMKIPVEYSIPHPIAWKYQHVRSAALPVYTKNADRWTKRFLHLITKHHDFSLQQRRLIFFISNDLTFLTQYLIKAAARHNMCILYVKSVTYFCYAQFFSWKSVLIFTVEIDYIHK